MSTVARRRIVLDVMAAGLVVLAHAGFVLFVVLGGLLALRWPKVREAAAAFPCGLDAQL